MWDYYTGHMWSEVFLSLLGQYRFFSVQVYWQQAEQALRELETAREEMAANG